MNRTNPCSMILALSLACVPAALAQAEDGAKPPATPLPNLLVLMVDDLDVASFQQLLDSNKLPHIKKFLIDEGTSFPEAFVSNSLCCPSRATFLTGQYAHNHGVQNVTGTNGGYSAFHPGGQDPETVASWLRDAGYYTALLGKYKNGYNVGMPAPAGWDFWRGLPNHRLVPGTYPVVDETGTAQNPGIYQTRYIGEAAVSVIENVPAGQPFFLFLAPTAPHVENLSQWDNDYLCNATPHPNFTGFLAPDRGNFDADPTIEGYSAQDYAPYGCPAHANGYAEMCLRNPDGTPLPGFDLPKLGQPSFDSFAGAPQAVRDKWESLDCDNNLGQLRRLHSQRLESMLSVDVMVSKVFTALIDEGKLDDTVVVFTSDNGYFLGEHRLGNKGLPYEESIRVPLVIRPLGERIHPQVHYLTVNIDLAPTLLDYAELPWSSPAYNVDGRSLERILEEAFRGLLWWRKAFLVEAEHPRGWPPTGPQSWWVFPDYRAVRTVTAYEVVDRMTYVEYDDPLWPGGYAEESLYDLATDPHQVVDRVDDPAYGDELNLLKGILRQLEDCSGDACRSAEVW